MSFYAPDDTHKHADLMDAGAASSVRAKLVDAKGAQQRLRWRVTGTALAIGVPLGLITVPIGFLCEFGLAPHLGIGPLWGMWVPWTWYFIFLGVLPTDRDLISRLCPLFVYLWVSGSAGFVLETIYAPYRERLDTEVGKAIGTLQFIGYTGACLFGSAVLSRAQLSRALEIREQLDAIWFSARTVFLIMGLDTLICNSLMACLEPDNYGSTTYCAAYFVNSASFLLSVPLFSPAARRKVQGFLVNIGSGGEASAAASVAALLSSKKDIDEVLEISLLSFRGLPFSALCEGDLTGEKENILWKRTEQKGLGEVDIFLSHSWHDDGAKKWQRLAECCAVFKAVNNREPLIWLDKACIDQTNIEKSLLCLPVYLSGCSELVIIVGETYTKRLWCVMEIYTFLKMGGSVDRIHLFPLDGFETLRGLFRGFDVRDADCFKPEDKQAMLAIIEAGFGDFDAFNKSVETIFSDKEEAVIHPKRRASVATRPTLLPRSLRHRRGTN